jgi:hypothetical protein
VESKRTAAASGLHKAKLIAREVSDLEKRGGCGGTKFEGSEEAGD